MSDTATTDTDVLFRDDVDDIEEMPTRASRRIVTAWTVVLAALVVAGAGFVAGVQIEKRNAPAAAASGLPPGLRSLANGGAFTGGQLPAATTQGDAGTAGATGKVKLVDGANVYITTSDGSTVKVATSSSSKRARLTIVGRTSLGMVPAHPGKGGSPSWTNGCASQSPKPSERASSS